MVLRAAEHLHGFTGARSHRPPWSPREILRAQSVRMQKNRSEDLPVNQARDAAFGGTAVAQLGSLRFFWSMTHLSETSPILGLRHPAISVTPDQAASGSPP